MAHYPKSVRRLLKDKPTLRRLGHEIDAQGAMLSDFRQLLPGDLATHCVAARIDGQRLVVHTDSPVWASRLRYMSAELCSLLQNAHPALREIKIKLLPGRGPTSRRRRPARRSDVAAAVVGDSARDVRQPQLRTALERLSETLKQRR